MADNVFSERLKVLMGDANGSEFARKCGLSESAVRKYLKQTQPRMDVLVRIADVTGASVEWLATGRGSPYPEQKIIEITPEVAQKLDMKEQYVRAICIRIYGLQAASDAEMNAETFYFTITMLHQLLLERFGGADISDDQMEAFLKEYVDKLAKQAGW